MRAGLDTHQQVGRHWQGKTQKPDVFEAKADLFETLAQLGVDPNNLQIVAEPATWSHPGRGGRVQLGPKNIIGWFGELHPKLVKDLDVPKAIAAFELNLDAIPQPRAKATKAKPALTISDLQTVKRDFAFVADQSVEAGKLLKAAGSADKKLITNVSLFDVFEGSNLGEGKKSLAIEVTIQPKDKTLTDEEIDAISQKVVAAVQKATKAELRG